MLSGDGARQHTAGLVCSPFSTAYSRLSLLLSQSIIALRLLCQSADVFKGLVRDYGGDLCYPRNPSSSSAPVRQRKTSGRSHEPRCFSSRKPKRLSPFQLTVPNHADVWEHML